MTVDEMKKRKEELNLSYEELAKQSGVPVKKVQETLQGMAESYEYEVLRALEEVLGCRRLDMVCESAVEFNREKRQGEYTLEDYYALPEDRRVELIDGVIYDMGAPTPTHQILATQIGMMFDRYIKEKCGNCVPIVSPVDVQLDCDNKTMVQPDVLIVCDRDKIDSHIFGHPDLVVEILSPSSRKKDNQIKLRKYMNAGVKEYWIVDPKQKKILVYRFEEEEWPTIYGFTDKISVNIFPEACEIDFSEINDYVGFLYE